MVHAANQNYIKSFTSVQHKNVQRLYGINSIYIYLASSRRSASTSFPSVTFPVIRDVHRLSRMLLRCPAQIQFRLLICSTTSAIFCKTVEGRILEERYLQTTAQDRHMETACLRLPIWLHKDGELYCPLKQKCWQKMINSNCVCLILGGNNVVFTGNLPWPPPVHNGNLYIMVILSPK